MRIALIVPGGVDRSGEFRVIPALIALIERLSSDNEVLVFALNQEASPAEWRLAGATIYNIGRRHTRLRTLRAIVSKHRTAPFAVVHAIWSGTCGLVAVMAGRMLGIPSLIHIAGGELVSMPHIDFGGSQTWRGRLREAMVLRTATAITAASAPIIEALSALGLQAQRVPLGVDLNRWPPRDPVRRAADRPARFIHIASLNRVKDQSTLLRALATLQQRGVDFALDIIGEDTLDGAIDTLSKDLGLAERVHFHGFLTQRQLRPLVESADLMILTSHHETGPVVLLEAALAGVPTVGTAVGHVAEWAPEAAIAVPIGDPAALAGAIGRLLDDEDLRLRIARVALQRATREDADYTAERFHALYHRYATEGLAK
jgi:glycosyltransferase involved in cell wall biosynthesis